MQDILDDMNAGAEFFINYPEKGAAYFRKMQEAVESDNAVILRNVLDDAIEHLSPRFILMNSFPGSNFTSIIQICVMHEAFNCLLACLEFAVENGDGSSASTILTSAVASHGHAGYKNQAGLADMIEKSISLCVSDYECFSERFRENYLRTLPDKFGQLWRDEEERQAAANEATLMDKEVPLAKDGTVSPENMPKKDMIF